MAGHSIHGVRVHGGRGLAFDAVMHVLQDFGDFVLTTCVHALLREATFMLPYGRVATPSHGATSEDPGHLNWLAEKHSSIDSVYSYLCKRCT